MKKFLLVSFCLFSVAFAGKGSIYSRFGIGEIGTLSNGRTAGMGHAGVATFSGASINFLNPASTGNIVRTLISAGYQYEMFSSEDASGTSLIGTGSFNEFGLAFPISSRNNIVLSLGMVPFSSVGYEQRTVQTVSGAEAIQVYEGRGGVTSGQISLSYSPMTDLTLGVTGHYLFGSIYRDQSISFSNSAFYGGSYNQTLSMSGVAATIGGIYTGIDKALGFSETKNIDFGMTLFSGSSLDLDNEILRNYSSNQDTLTPASSTVGIPVGIAAGVSYLHNRVMYAADLHFQNWENFTINGVHPSEIQNSIRVGAGLEFLPTDNIGGSFWQKASFRAGGYYRMTNLNISGESINEMFATAGVGLPFSFESRINLGLEAGIRGSVSAALIKDTIVRFTVSVTASEMMFIPPIID
ncbi:MAG: hypothetical protein ACYC09_05905 [Bacteroidota bacterium]